MNKFGFREVGPLLYAAFIDIFGFSLAFPTLTAIFTDPNCPLFSHPVSSSVRFLVLAISYSVYSLAMFFGSAFLGDLSDIIHRKKVLLISLTGLTLSYIVMGFSISASILWLFIAARAFAGLMAGNFPTALAAIVDLSTEENKAYNMGLVSLAQCVGFVIGPTLGGLLSMNNLSLPFFATAVLAFAALIWVWAGFTETFVKKTGKKFSLIRVINALWEGVRHHKVRVLSLAFFIMQAGLSCFLTIAPIYLKELFHYSNAQVGYFNGYLGIALALALLVALPLLVKRFKIEMITTVSLFIAVPFIFLPGVFKIVIGIWIFGFFLSFFNQLAYAGMYTSYSNAVDANSQGWVMGIGISTVALSWSATAFLTLLVPIIGASNLMLIGSGLYLLSALIMLYYVKTLWKVSGTA